MTSLSVTSLFKQRGIVSLLFVLVTAMQLSGCNSESTKVVSSEKPSTGASTQAPQAQVQTPAIQTPVAPRVKEPVKPLKNEHQVSTPPSSYLDEGKRSLAHNDPATATELFSKATEANPLDADAYFQRAQAEKQSKDNNSALRDLKKTIELRPEYFEARMSLAYLLAQMHEQKQSLQEYIKATQLRPDNYDAWEGRAWMHNSLKQYTQGADCAKRAIELNPKTAGNAREFLAGSYNALEKWDLALGACNEGIKYKPHSDWLFQMRGQAEEHLDELPAAIRDYKKAIEMNPKAWNWLYPGLVSCYDRLLKDKELN